MTDTVCLADGETDELACGLTDTQGCAVYQSLTSLPHYESAFLTTNPVPWMRCPVPHNDRLVSAVLLSLLEEVRQNVLLSTLKSP